MILVWSHPHLLSCYFITKYLWDIKANYILISSVKMKLRWKLGSILDETVLNILNEILLSVMDTERSLSALHKRGYDVRNCWVASLTSCYRHHLSKAWNWSQKATQAIQYEHAENGFFLTNLMKIGIYNQEQVEPCDNQNWREIRCSWSKTETKLLGK